MGVLGGVILIRERWAQKRLADRFRSWFREFYPSTVLTQRAKSRLSTV